MNTKKTMLYTLLALGVAFVILSVTLEAIISNRIGDLMSERLKDSKTEVEKLFLLESAFNTTYVTENSYWDELCKAVESKDTSWISTNMTNSLISKSKNVNLLYIIDNKGEIIYKKLLGNFPTNYNFSIPQNSSLLDTINAKTIFTGCIKDGLHYTHLDAATIVRGNDFEHKGKKFGYLFVGKLIDNNFLSSLTNLNSSFNYNFLPNNKIEGDIIDVKEAKFSFCKKMPIVNADSLAVKVSNNVPEIKVYGQFVRYSLIGFLTLVLAATMFVFYLFIKRFFNPLIKISTALEQKSNLPIINVREKKTELGEIARLIEAHFKQNKILEEEIKHRKESEVKLKLALENIEKSTLEKIKAEQAADAKSDFLSTMSHEIRTPINGVIGIINLLKEEKLSKKQKDYVDVLHFSAKHLMSLVTDILDFSKIESGKIEFEHASFDLHQLCHSLYHLHKVNAVEKGISIKFDPDKNLENFFYGDAIRLNQIINNLLNNAIKFTSKGSVEFGYKLISETVSTATLEFKVKDTGIGMTEEEQQKIFDGFAQANNKISGHYGGTGLGLTICKKLIELQGGKLTVKSQPKVGTEFIFYISLQKHAYANETTTLPVLAANTRNNLQGMKVLIAEDNKINIIVIKNFLEKWGVNFKISTNGKEAVDMVNKEQFDAILMDLHMPEMNGEEATKIIRNYHQKKLNSIPIIALTANASVEMQQKLLNEGFNNYLSKPFNPDTLFKLLKKYYYEN